MIIVRNSTNASIVGVTSDSTASSMVTVSTAYPYYTLSRHEQQIGAFLYTTVIVLVFAATIIYFMLKRICYEEKRKLRVASVEGLGNLPPDPECSSDIFDLASMFAEHERAVRFKRRNEVHLHLVRLGHVIGSENELALLSQSPQFVHETIKEELEDNSDTSNELFCHGGGGGGGFRRTAADIELQALPLVHRTTSA